MLSRAKTSRGIKICNFNPSHIKVKAGALEEMKRMEAESKLQWISPIEKIGQGLLLTGDPHVVVFFHFLRKFENSKWPPFLGRGKFFEN